MPLHALPTASADGEDGMNFSGRNLRQDFKNFGQQSFSGMSSGGGLYGMGSGSTRNFSLVRRALRVHTVLATMATLPPAAPIIPAAIVHQMRCLPAWG